MNDEIASQIEIIELALIKRSVLGFDPAILTVLDDVEIGQGEIENLKAGLGSDVFIYLFNIANSAYHGSLPVGPAKHFFDVVNRIGMQRAKALIILFAMHSLARGDQGAELIFAKNFAASVLGRVMSHDLGFQDDGARKVELACLIAGIGALMMIVYRNHYHTADFDVSADFVALNHLWLTARIIRRFNLPDYLYEMIMTNCLTLDRRSIGLASVVKLATAAVEWSFQTLDNKLVFQSPHTSRKCGLPVPLAAIFEEQFAAAGLKKYLIILPAADLPT